MNRSLLLLILALAWAGCTDPSASVSEVDEAPYAINLAHLDHLGELVTRGDTTYRLIHIYAEAPDYAWVGDDDEGIVCVDDVARAAVVYLRHYAATGDAASREKAEQLLRFVLYMQRPDGLFYNFIWDNTLRINTEHPNSLAEPFGWWAARAVWALGEGAATLALTNPALADAAADAVQQALPHAAQWLERYGETETVGERTVPQWLIYRTASDATSEFLLGLHALQSVRPDPVQAEMIDQFAEGVAQMQYGSMRRYPYGGHASWAEHWHGWGNAQTQALSRIGRLPSPRYEAQHFYPRLLVEGWRHEMALDDSTRIRWFEQIAYAVRGVAVGLIRLYEATGDPQYATMAGLAASWFMGNNVAETPMYDPATGRGYDGILSPDTINWNAGAESTIEALLTLHEVGRHPAARSWLHARADPAARGRDAENTYYYRRFTQAETGRTVGVVMNLTQETTTLYTDDAFDAFLARLTSP